jgi:hypothetical protein
MRLFVATRKIGDKAKKPKSEADKLFDKYFPDSIAGKPDPNLSSKFKKFYEEWHSAFEEEGLFDNDRRFRIRSLVHPAYIINKKTGQRRPRPINFPEFFTYSDPITWRPLEQIKTYDRRVNRFKALYCYINRFRFANRALGLRHVSTCTMDRKIVLWEDKSTLGIWPGPIEKYPNPLYSIAGIYERGKERQSRPAGLQVFDVDYETVEDEYGEYEIEGPGKLGEKEDNLSRGPASRDKERDPGDYAIANDVLGREYEGDTRGVSYRKDESYVNELPHRRKTNKKHASQAARTARDGFGSSYSILGACLECGGDLAKGLLVWNSHATKYIMQDFVDIHRDDIVCLQCGLIHKLPADGPKITPAMDGCLLDGTLQNDMSIYVPFDLELYEKSKADRICLLKKYYENNPDAKQYKKPPEDKDLALPIQEYYKKHDRLTLKGPEKGLQPEKIKQRQIVRTIMAMWSREELPDDPIMVVKNSTIKQRCFSKKFEELYDLNSVALTPH